MLVHFPYIDVAYTRNLGWSFNADLAGSNLLSNSTLPLQELHPENLHEHQPLTWRIRLCV